MFSKLQVHLLATGAYFYFIYFSFRFSFRFMALPGMWIKKYEAEKR